MKNLKESGCRCGPIVDHLLVEDLLKIPEITREKTVFGAIITNKLRRNFKPNAYFSEASKKFG